jgi:WD40 repeat protein
MSDLDKYFRAVESIVQIRLFMVLRGHRGGVDTVRFSSDGNLIASADGGELRLWKKGRNGSYTLYHVIDASTNRVAFSPDGSLIASAGGRRGVRLWSLEGSCVAEFHPDESEVAFTPDGMILVTGDTAGYVRIRDVVTRKLLYEFRGGSDQKDISGPVTNLSFAPDGRRLAFCCSGKRGSVRVCDIQGSGLGRATWTIKGVDIMTSPKAEVAALSFSPDWQFLAVAASCIWLFDAESLVLVGALDLPTSSDPIAIAFSPDGRLLAVATGEGMVWIWNVATRQIVTSFGAHTDVPIPDYISSVIGVIDWSPVEKLIATSGMGVFLIYDPQKGHDVPGQNDYTVKLWKCKWRGEKRK